VTATEGPRCFWCGEHCEGTCLGVDTPSGPVQMRPTDPAYWMLADGHTSTPTVYREACYICRDPEFAQMGLPLCRLCPSCTTGHIPADDTRCDDCGFDDMWDPADAPADGGDHE
jgi:hypothetical protein